MENGRIGYHGLRFFAYEKKMLWEPWQYPDVYEKGTKKNMCTLQEWRWEFWRQLAWEIRCLKWRILLCIWVFQVLQVTTVFYTDLTAKFSSSFKQAGANTMNSHTLVTWSCNPLLTRVAPPIAVGLLTHVGLLVCRLVWLRVCGFECSVGFAKDGNLPLW